MRSAPLLPKPVPPLLPRARMGPALVERAQRRCRNCPLGSVQDFCEWHASGTAVEDDAEQPVCLRFHPDRRVRPVLGDHHLVGKSLEGSRQPGWGDSNSGPASERLPSHSVVSGLTCGSLAPVVTARARCSPLPAGSACTQRVPVGSGPVRSWTPSALRSSATRDRSAGHGKADTGAEWHSRLLGCDLWSRP
jgi:hypothetical protein